MSIILKIHGIGLSNAIDLKNRPDMGKKHLHGKSYPSNNNISFDKYLETQLKDNGFASHFKNAGKAGDVSIFLSFNKIILK